MTNEFVSVPVEFFEVPEPFPDLPALAARLGVPKKGKSERAAVVLTMKNGDEYSLFAIINAFLDRMDSALPNGER